MGISPNIFGGRYSHQIPWESEFFPKEVFMQCIERPIYYFEQAGYGNTSDVAEIAYKRLKEGDIKSVVVASSSGETGLEFAKRMARDTNLVVVSSHPGYSAPGVWNFNIDILKELESMGCRAISFPVWNVPSVTNSQELPIPRSLQRRSDPFWVLG
jgi:hypothetical protein